MQEQMNAKHDESCKGKKLSGVVGHSFRPCKCRSVVGWPSLLSSPVRAPDVRLPDHLKILSYAFVLFCFFLKLKPILISKPYARPCDPVALMPGT